MNKQEYTTIKLGQIKKLVDKLASTPSYQNGTIKQLLLDRIGDFSETILLDSSEFKHKIERSSKLNPNYLK